MRNALRAPGRVDLLGDHTDYNERFALPATLELEWVVSAERPSDRLMRLTSRVEVADLRIFARPNWA
jgi:galactokinase